MYWIIQNNICNEENYQYLIDAVDRSGSPYEVVKVIPFSHDLEPPVVPSEGPVMVYGSMTLTQRIAPKHNWLVFTNDKFDYTICAEVWDDLMLNADSNIGTFKDVELPDSSSFFIRPVKDNKAFSGMVIDHREYQNWLGRLFANEEASDMDFTMDEVVMVTKPKKILKEIRFFVVDGSVVTHSTYKVGNRVTYLEEQYTDYTAIDFIEGCVSYWQPHAAFVLDVAETEEGYKIIEVNCINSAGLYRADPNKLVGEIIDLQYKYTMHDLVNWDKPPSILI